MCKDKMAVTLSDDQLPALLDSLKDIPQAVNIRGEIRCKLNSVVTDFDFIVDSWPDYKALVGRVNPTTAKIRGEITSKLNSVITDYDFIVDSWPDYKALVVRVNPTTAKYPVHLGPLVSVYARDPAALETLLQKPCVIDWSSRIIFICVNERAQPAVIKATESQHRVVEEMDTYQLMTLTKDALKLSPIPDGFKSAKILPEQAHLINSLWKYNDGQHSEIYIKDLVTKLPSCCLYNEEGNVVGFALRYHYGAIGILHVLEEFRGKGYGKVIMSNLAYSCLQKDKEIFVLPEEENIVSIKLHEGIGFVKNSDSKWFALVLDE